MVLHKICVTVEDMEIIVRVEWKIEREVPFFNENESNWQLFVLKSDKLKLRTEVSHAILPLKLIIRFLQIKIYFNL